MTSNWMDVREAVEYARHNLSAETLRSLCRKNRIEHGSNGRSWLFLPEHIDRYFLKMGKR